MTFRPYLAAALILALAACSSAPGPVRSDGKGSLVGSGSAKGGRPAHCPDGSPYPPAKEDLSTRGDYTAGGLYKPGVKDSTPTYIPQVECIPEPEVRNEARSAVGNRSPYTVLGKQYKVLEHPDGFVEKGTASYYGAKFHGRLTSNREVYDMYTFSAAHKTLPLPSFARVTNLDNGESVVVRVNDRGPFHDGRVIDLSYAAAVRLGITGNGTGRVEVRALTPGKPDRHLERREVAATQAARSAVPVASSTIAAQTAGMAADPAHVRTESLPSSTAVVPQGAMLQVASFSSRENAERALQRLRQGGVSGGLLVEVPADGRSLWRLRVAGADTAALPALMERISALGLGQPQVVRE